MSNINRRLKKVEKALNVDGEQRVVEIVVFNDGELPPEQTDGIVTLHCIRYRDICKEKNPTMLIFLGKNELGQTDRQEHDVKGVIGTRELSEEELRELVKDTVIPCEDAIAR